MALVSGINPMSALRESKIIANQETIVNQTEITTPSNGRFKRTVYHTPAIIQTVVDTPQVIQPSIARPIGEFRSQVQSRLPVRRIQSGITNQYVSRPSTSIMERRQHSYATREDSYDYKGGVKVNEDLSTFRPSAIPRVQQAQQVKERGFCQQLFGYCWGNKCSLWICLLIPLLILLLMIVVSACVNRHRIFYGFDNSTINQNQEYRNGYNSNLNQNTYQQTQQQFDLNSNQQSNSVLTNIHRQPEVVSPLVSTDHPRSLSNDLTNTLNNGLNTINNTLSDDANTFSNAVRSNINNVHPNNDLNGLDIYSRVKSLQQQSNNNNNSDELVNQNRGISLSSQSNTGFLNGSATSDTTARMNGIRLAPTIQELRTNEMLENQRLQKTGVNHQHNITSHKWSHHLRHFNQ